MSRSSEVERMFKPGFTANLIARDPAFKPPKRVTKKVAESEVELDA
jgi:hypothetical protein